MRVPEANFLPARALRRRFFYPYSQGGLDAPARQSTVAPFPVRECSHVYLATARPFLGTPGGLDGLHAPGASEDDPKRGGAGLSPEPASQEEASGCTPPALARRGAAAWPCLRAAVAAE
eukprot:COSAG06_NODE_1217_length_10218_cov_129.446981_1_plen_119_part_00